MASRKKYVMLALFDCKFCEIMMWYECEWMWKHNGMMEIGIGGEDKKMEEHRMVYCDGWNE